MKQDKIIIFILFQLLFLVKVKAQQDADAFIQGYYDREYFYFDSVWKSNFIEQRSIDSFYKLYVLFRVDTNSSVIDFRISGTFSEKLPLFIKNDIERLFRLTEGKWIPKLENDTKVLSDEIIYLIYVLNKNDTITERVKKTEKLIEYELYHAEMISLSEKFYKQKRRVVLSLGY